MNNKYAAGTARTAAHMRMHCPPERYDTPSDRAYSCTKTDILRPDRIRQKRPWITAGHNSIITYSTKNSPGTDIRSPANDDMKSRSENPPMERLTALPIGGFDRGAGVDIFHGHPSEAQKKPPAKREVERYRAPGAESQRTI